MSNKTNFTTSDKTQKAQYEIYIANHIRNVKYAYKKYESVFKIIFPNVYSNINTLNQLKTNINIHDKSKYDYNEFKPYANKFFPIVGTDPNSIKCESRFQVAWLHHIHNNPHHPAHWVLYDDGNVIVLNMPDIYIIEMLCDWLAMGIYYGTTLESYWESESAQKLPMTKYTKSKIEEFINYLEENNLSTLE
jgi:hypothetical protein